MSPVALTLNLALGALLISALLLGLRLDRRLKILRDSHAGFAKAVSELDLAAVRTEAGLAEMKATAERAGAALADRIDTAQALCERLGRLMAEAEVKAEVKADALAQRPPAVRPIVLRQPAPPEAAPAAPAPVAVLTPIASARSRAMVDDDLFDTVRPALATLTGGRR